ncbi:MAG: hypothetical protein KBT02_11170 [Treponema sp.]|nr:hypothetical protein [Candidatus Treponema caballi]
MMRRISFHGSDDGFTMLGAVFILLVLLLLLPAVAERVSAEYRDVRTQYEEVMDEAD